MADDMYSVRLNRRDGTLEITGPDKDWVSKQLDRLSVVYEAAIDSLPAEQPAPTEPATSDSKPAQRRRPARRAGSARTTSKSSELDGLLTKEVTDKLHG